MKSSAETPHQKKLCLKSGHNCPHIRSPSAMPKAKSRSTDRVLCACGCRDVMTRRTQTRHLQGHGPLMAVADVLKTRAYFRNMIWTTLDHLNSGSVRRWSLLHWSSSHLRHPHGESQVLPANETMNCRLPLPTRYQP